MPSSGETKPEKERIPYEQRPKQINPDTARKIGEQAIKGAQKGKSGK